MDSKNYLINTKIIILTLEKYPERLHKMTDFINQLNCNGFTTEIYYGVLGTDIDVIDTHYENIKILDYHKEKKLYNKSVRLNGELMNKGEFACAWSHIKIYEQLLKDEYYDNYLILEDDADMICSQEHFNSLLLNFPKDFDILHLSMSDFWPFIKIEKVNDYYYVPYKRFFNRTTGYVISKNGAEKLLKYTENHINIPIDDLLSSMYINTDLKLYVPENFIIEERKNNESIIYKLN